MFKNNIPALSVSFLDLACFADRRLIILFYQNELTAVGSLILLLHFMGFNGLRAYALPWKFICGPIRKASPRSGKLNKEITCVGKYAWYDNHHYQLQNLYQVRNLAQSFFVSMNLNIEINYPLLLSKTI